MLLSVSIDDIMSFNVDVGDVIKDYCRHLRGGVYRVTAKAPQFAYIMNRKLQSDNVPRRHNILHVMKGSHASTMAQLQ